LTVFFGGKLTSHDTQISNIIPKATCMVDSPIETLPLRRRATILTPQKLTSNRLLQCYCYLYDAWRRLVSSGALVRSWSNSNVASLSPTRTAVEV